MTLSALDGGRLGSVRRPCVAKKRRAERETSCRSAVVIDGVFRVLQ